MLKKSALIASAITLIALSAPFAVYAQVESTTTHTAPPTFRTAPPVPPFHAGSEAGTLKGNFQQNTQQFRDAIQATRALFQQKLQTIKDTRKQQIVTTINDKIPMVNTNQTDRMNKTLAEMTKIITRISTKSGELKTQGKDTTILDSAITAAQTAIQTAQTAVTTQAAKVYTVSIVSDTTLKTTVGSTVSLLRQDLTTTQIAVKNARLAVLYAYQALLPLMGITPTPLQTTVNTNATSSAGASSIVNSQ